MPIVLLSPKWYVLIQKSSTVFNNSKTGVNYGKTEKKTSLL